MRNQKSEVRSQKSEVRSEKQGSIFDLRSSILGLLAGAALALLAIALSLGAASDDFQADRVQLNSPPANGFVITPADGADLANVTRSIMVGTGGDLVVVYAGNHQQCPIKNWPSGSRLWGRFSRVMSTGTTASNLIGEY